MPWKLMGVAAVVGSLAIVASAAFTDAPEDRGLLVSEPEELYRWVSGADAAGLQVMVHAIGDRANELILDIYERVARENGPRDRRFRIEQNLVLTDHAAHRSDFRDSRQGLQLVLEEPVLQAA